MADIFFEDPVVVPFAIVLVGTDSMDDGCCCAAFIVLVLLWVAMFAMCHRLSSSAPVVVDAEPVVTPPVSEKA